MILTGFEKHIDARKGVIHVGANVGEEREWYRTNSFKPVLWFEPNTELIPELEFNLEKYRKNIAFNFGIHDTLKSADLHIANNGGQSSSILELGTHAVNHPDVKYVRDKKIRLIRLDEFFETSGYNIRDFNFLNVDVQGVELSVIKSLGFLIEEMDYIYTEVNEEEVYKGCDQIGEIDNYLFNHGFKRVKTVITKAKWGDAFYIKIK